MLKKREEGREKWNQGLIRHKGDADNATWGKRLLDKELTGNLRHGAVLAVFRRISEP